MEELADTASTSSSSSVSSTFSSSSSNAVPAPKMAGPSSVEDFKLWPSTIEKQFIEILVEEQAKGNIRNGQMKKNHWQVVTDEFYQRTGKRYQLLQISQKFKRLKQRYHAFSQLIGIEGMRWDRATNTVTGSDGTWSEAVLLNHKCREFRSKGLDHYELLGQLFQTGTASSAQPDSPDDVVEVFPPDMGQGSNPKGKQPAHSSDTSTRKKRKATDVIMETELSRKTHSDKDNDSQKTVEPLDPLSMAKAVKILNPMFDSRSDSTLFKVIDKLLEKPECRQTFITLKPERRQGYIEYLTSLP